MSVKGQITTAEPLEYSDFLRLLSGLHEDGNYLWELYCCISVCTACRVSDVLSMKWKDVLERDAFYKIERKTGKTRQIPFNENVQRRIASLYKLLGSPDKRQPVICNPKTRKPYTKQYINDTLKYLRVKYRLPIRRFSSHTFRKTFGRYVYDSKERTTESLILLSMILNHSSLNTTKVYLVIRQDEISGIFESIKLNY